MSALRPSSILYRPAADGSGGSEVYFGEWSTLQGLGLLDRELPVCVDEFHPDFAWEPRWESAEALPRFETVGELRDWWAEHDDEISLVDVTIRFEGFGCLSSHDGGECSFVLEDPEGWKALVASAFGLEVLVGALQAHPGEYGYLEPDGSLVFSPEFPRPLAE